MNVICPQCGRTLKARQNKFGDWCYPRHNMATVETSDELAGFYGDKDINLAVTPDYQMPCPMAGQPLEE